MACWSSISIIFVSAPKGWDNCLMKLRLNQQGFCHFERQREILRNRKKISQSLALLRNDKVMADYFPSPKSLPSV
jgi:hypothetical protein